MKNNSRVKLLSVIAVVAFVVLVSTPATTRATTIGTNISTGGDLTATAGNLTVGNGTPSVTQNGEDAYIEGTFEVDGTSRFDNAITINYGVATYVTGDIIAGITRTGALTQTSGSNTGITDLNIRPTSALTKITTANQWNYNLANISTTGITATTDTSNLVATNLHLEAGTDADITYRSLWIENGNFLFQHSGSVASNMLTATYANTAYNDNTGLFNIQRTGALTLQTNNDTVNDFKIIPNMVLTALSGAGSASYNITQIDARSVSVTASVGTTNVNALRIHAATDSDSTNLAIRASGANLFDQSGWVNNSGALTLSRTTAMTGVNGETSSDLYVNPTSALTGPASGTANFYGIRSDLSGTTYVAGAGFLVTAAVYAKPANNLNSNNYAFYSDGKSRFSGQLAFLSVPTTTDGIINYDLGNFTSGTLMKGAVSNSTTLASSLTGIDFDFRTNLTTTNYGVNGVAIILPTATNTSGTTNIVGLGINDPGLGGTITQNGGGSTTNWYGGAIVMPTTVQTAGTVNAYGLAVIGGVNTSSTVYNGINVTMNADTDVALNIAKGKLTMGDNALISRDVNAGLTASTTQTQGQGALTAEINEVSTVANANDTVTLISASAGLCQTIINNGANILKIFPASGDNLGTGANTATTLAAGTNFAFCAYNSTNWELMSSAALGG